VKIFLLEPDRKLADSIDACLNGLRLKMKVKKIETEEQILNEDPESLLTYALFILNLKNPSDPCVMKYLRKNGVEAPILLILEPNVETDLFKTLYYLSYDDVIVKTFSPEEITFHIYKLCDIWNDDLYFFSKDVYVDFKHCKFVHHDEETFLGKKEALLLKFLSLKSPHIVSFDEIACYVYQDEVVSEERIRSLVRQLRAKIPFHVIETVKGEGYKIVANKIEEESHESTLPSSLSSFLLSCASIGNYCLPFLVMD
jgi:DNA-binding response OmpR family regulator